MSLYLSRDLVWLSIAFLISASLIQFVIIKFGSLLGVKTKELAHVLFESILFVRRKIFESSVRLQSLLTRLLKYRLIFSLCCFSGSLLLLCNAIGIKIIIQIIATKELIIR